MTCLGHVFTIRELEQLDEKQLAILDAAILREIQTSKVIREILRKKLKRTLYYRYQAKAKRALEARRRKSKRARKR
jgi:hypothetical protein